MAASVIVTVVGVVAAASSKILADEFKAWRPRLTAKLVSFAASKLPESQREEWTSYVGEIPGEVGKVLAAVGLLSAAIKIGYVSERGSQRGIVASGARLNWGRIGLLNQLGRISSVFSSPDFRSKYFKSLAAYNMAAILLMCLGHYARHQRIFQDGLSTSIVVLGGLGIVCSLIAYWINRRQSRRRALFLGT
jgi:hypothetical protein